MIGFVFISFFVCSFCLNIQIIFNSFRNRCLVTGRSRGYYRMFGLSRHVIRDMSHYGLLPGITKSSW